MDHRREAVDLLQHYHAIATGCRSAGELGNDALVELESIVDHIIAAAVDKVLNTPVEKLPIEQASQDALSIRLREVLARNRK